MQKEREKGIQILFEDNSLAQDLIGPEGQNLKFIEKKLGIKIHVRGSTLSIHGETESVQLAQKALNQLYSLAKRGYPVGEQDIEKALPILSDNPHALLSDILLGSIIIPAKKKVIHPRTLGQKNYVASILANDLVFGIGPAGTGKTYLAMTMAVSALLKGEFERIILTRPAIEAGEKLGFLPGDLIEKVNPYLRPLYDALHDMCDLDKARKMLDRGEIEVAPLAFMRGRTLNQAFVILDEAQNCTEEQMKMFLTRIGFRSKAVVTGDITQIDLPPEKKSGLIHASQILKEIPGIVFHYLTEQDVVRHPLVKEIIKAYENSRKNDLYRKESVSGSLLSGFRGSNVSNKVNG